MPEHLSRTQHLHLMHKMEFLPIPFSHTEHGNLEVFNSAVLLPVQKPLSFARLLSTFFCHRFFPSCISHFYLWPAISEQHQIIIISSFKPLSLTPFLISSTTITNKKGLSTESWWAPIITLNFSNFLLSIRTDIVIFLYLSVMVNTFLSITSFFSVHTKSLLLVHDQKPFPNQQIPYRIFPHDLTSFSFLDWYEIALSQAYKFLFLEAICQLP